MKKTAWTLERPVKGRPRIRREWKDENGKRKSESYPQKKWAHLPDEELADFVIRLNGKDPRIERIKDRLDFEHAFIGPEFLSEYQDIYLRSFIPDQRTAKTLSVRLKEYALNYFIADRELANPLEWKRHEAEWGLHLLKKNKSRKVIQSAVYELNRFMRFLHSKHPDIPPLVFEPLSRAVLKEHESGRHLRGEIKKTSYVSDKEWKELEKKLAEDWGAIPKLCYYYGLRLAEAYGLKRQDVKKGFLLLERQFYKIKDGERVFKPTKGRYERRTPHWLITPAQAYALIEQVERVRLHIDTISHKFVALCPYKIHDLRRTFITNCVRLGKSKEDVRLAVGHVYSATTDKYYLMDARDLDGEEWEPAS